MDSVLEGFFIVIHYNKFFIVNGAWFGMGKKFVSGRQILEYYIPGLYEQRVLNEMTYEERGEYVANKILNRFKKSIENLI